MRELHVHATCRDRFQGLTAGVGRGRLFLSYVALQSPSNGTESDLELLMISCEPTFK